jgi:hypothetical protein
MKARGSSEGMGDCVALLFRANRPMTRAELMSECELHDASVRRYVNVLMALELICLAPSDHREHKSGPVPMRYRWNR